MGSRSAVAIQMPHMQTTNENEGRIMLMVRKTPTA